MIGPRPAQLRSQYDVVVVGAGPGRSGGRAGSAANVAPARCCCIDREIETGGILNQCIHAGFGLHTFGEELTGPEFAQRSLEQLIDHDIDILTESFALDLDDDGLTVMSAAPRGAHGRSVGAVVLANGARERTRGAIRIPGSRPSGVMTAGLAQKFVNVFGQLPGRRVVILGSGDVGLIMARRLALEGLDVVGVFELHGPRQRPQPQHRPVPARLRHPAAPLDHGGRDPRQRAGHAVSPWPR